MTEWTPSAKAELERYFARVRPGLAGSGADAAEVEEDLKRHIDEEIATARLKTVTEDDVRRILARIGEPEPPAVEASRPERSKVEGILPSPTAAPPRNRLALLVFGVLLPALTLGIELVTRMCAGAFFNPLPTGWHILLVAAVPVSNLLVWQALREGGTAHRRGLAWANAFAIGVTLFYSFIFVPLVIPATIAIIFFGWGLLPLSPLFGLVASLRLRHHLRQLGQPPNPPRLRGLWAGAALGFAAVLVFQVPSSLTQIGLLMATSGTPRTEARGIRWLRSLGDQQTLLRSCYGRTQWAANWDPLTWLFADGKAVSAADARNIYYRVTGRAFNSVPPPKIFTARGKWNVLEDEFTWDSDQGGDAVAGRVKGLSLVSSRQDGLIDADAALAYTEWILEFKNVSPLQREARAQILLPPGGVVSRLTLWINGEEQEAAFGGRGQVREAYQKVVSQRRDPVLVTTCGPDRVLMQCFPVPPNGGSMKVRIGVTAPLFLANADEGVFRWPCFLERNFTIPDGFRHIVWAESRRLLATTGGKLRTDRAPTGLAAVRGELAESDLSQPQNGVRARREDAPRQSWTVDVRDSARRIIRQVIVESEPAPPGRVVFVIDGSLGMRDHFLEIANTLKQMPDGIEFELLVADDGSTNSGAGVRKGSAQVYRQAADDLGRHRAAGGQDNVPALVQAWDLAAGSPSGVVVWIHGPQPVLLDNAELLKQRFERRPTSPVLVEIQTQAGPNRLLEKLDGIPAIRSVPRLGTLSEDVGRLIAKWNGQTNASTLRRERLEPDVSVNSMHGREASMHLARLWAADEIKRLVAARKLDEALELARRYQLVTPVSGAVVLETKAEYQAAGLQPVDATTVPAVPEPSTWALIAVGLLVLATTARSRRVRRKANEVGV